MLYVIFSANLCINFDVIINPRIQAVAINHEYQSGIPNFDKLGKIIIPKYITQLERLRYIVKFLRSFSKKTDFIAYFDNFNAALNLSRNFSKVHEIFDTSTILYCNITSIIAKHTSRKASIV